MDDQQPGRGRDRLDGYLPQFELTLAGRHAPMHRDTRARRGSCRPTVRARESGMVDSGSQPSPNLMSARSSGTVGGGDLQVRSPRVPCMLAPLACQLHGGCAAERHKAVTPWCGIVRAGRRELSIRPVERHQDDRPHARTRTAPIPAHGACSLHHEAARLGAGRRGGHAAVGTLACGVLWTVGRML
jgi:hypothetical protein